MCVYTVEVIGMLAIYNQAHDGEARQTLMPLCSVMLGIPPYPVKMPLLNECLFDRMPSHSMTSPRRGKETGPVAQYACESCMPSSYSATYLLC